MQRETQVPSTSRLAQSHICEHRADVGHPASRLPTSRRRSSCEMNMAGVSTGHVRSRHLSLIPPTGSTTRVAARVGVDSAVRWIQAAAPESLFLFRLRPIHTRLPAAARTLRRVARPVERRILNLMENRSACRVASAALRRRLACNRDRRGAAFPAGTLREPRGGGPSR